MGSFRAVWLEVPEMRRGSFDFLDNVHLNRCYIPPTTRTLYGLILGTVVCVDKQPTISNTHEPIPRCMFESREADCLL